MTKILFEMETGEDLITPFTVVNALVECSDLSLGDLEDIAEHLRIYVRRCGVKQAAMREAVDLYRKEHGLE